MVVGLSSSNAARATANTLVETVMKQTAARIRCLARKARQIASCGGSEVYLARTEAAGRAFPRRNSSNGWRRHRRRFKIVHAGSNNVASAVGA